MTATDPACRCKVVQRDEWGRATVELDFRIEQCPMHKAAPETAKRLKLAERTIEAYQRLCMAYRIGTHPSDSALDAIREWKTQAEACDE